MDINRLKFLSGINSDVQETKNFESSKTYDNIKFVQEPSFRRLATHFNAKSCILEDVGGYTSGTVLFEATDDSSSVDKLNTFNAAWEVYTVSSTLSEAYKVNQAYHSDEYPPISGLEGPFKYADGRVLYYSPKINKYYDSKADIYVNSNDVLHNEPTKTTPTEGILDDSTDDCLNEVGNTNFFQGVDDKDNTMQDRTGQHKDSTPTRKTPADVIKSVTQRKRELQKSIEQYDTKGFNQDSQKEKAIECLDKIIDNLASNSQDGFKQAQIYFATLMTPITDLFPSKLVLFLADESEVREQEELHKGQDGKKDRASVLKGHIEHYKNAMRFYSKDMYTYKDLSKAIERFQKELDSIES